LSVRQALSVDFQGPRHLLTLYFIIRLWASYLVTHRCRAERTHWQLMLPQATSRAPLYRFTSRFVALGERVASLLEDSDALWRQDDFERAYELFQNFAKIIADIEDFNSTLCSFAELASPGSHIKTSAQCSPDSLTATILQGYGLACLIHSAVAAWNIARTFGTRPNGEALNVPIAQDRLQSLCEDACRTISELAVERYGLMTGAPILFFIDSAWIGYAALEEYGGRNISEVRSWFMDIGAHMAGTGYRPLREPWMKTWSFAGGLESEHAMNDSLSL